MAQQLVQEIIVLGTMLAQLYITNTHRLVLPLTEFFYLPDLLIFPMAISCQS